MDKTTVLMIFGMALVTYIPRMLPFVILDGKKMPPFIQGVLQNVPYAVLGALIFPGVLFVNEQNVLFGIIGAIVAFITAFLGVNVILVVLSSIFILSIYSLL